MKTKDKQRHLNALERGFAAAKQSYHISANPFPLKSVMRAKWNEGWLKYKKQFNNEKGNTT